MEKCVCYDELSTGWCKCRSITAHEFLRGHKCDSNCPFYKTETEYKAQTGMSYQKAMQIAEKYNRGW